MGKVLELADLEVETFVTTDSGWDLAAQECETEDYTNCFACRGGGGGSGPCTDDDCVSGFENPDHCSTFCIDVSGMTDSIYCCG